MTGKQARRTPEPLLVDLACLLLPTLWIGLLVGVCFIATPAKFLASSLSLPVALDLGRATFAVWNTVEWVLLALMVAMLVFSKRLNPALAVGMLGILLPVQSVFLLPALNARIATIIADGAPGADARSSNLHCY